MGDDRDLVAKLAGGGALLFAGSMFQAGSTFFVRTYLARFLGRDMYGVLTVGISALVLATTLTMFGVGRGVGRYIPRFDDEEEKKGTVYSGLALIAPPLGVGVLAVYLHADTVARHVLGGAELAAVARLLVIALPFAVAIQFTVGVTQGQQRSFPKFLTQSASRPFVTAVGVVVVAELQYGLFSMILAYVLGYVVAGGIGIYYIVEYLRPFRRCDLVWRRRELFVFSVPLVAVTTIRVFFLDLDVLMLASLTDESQVGTYGSVFPIVKLFSIFLASFAFLSMPIFSELDAAGDRAQMRRLYRTVAKWTLLSTIPVALVMILFPTRVIELTFGAEYTAGAPALQVLTGAYFVHAAVGPNSNALISLGNNRVLAIDNVLAAVINAILNLVVIPPYGFFGAAAATACSYILRNALVSYHLYRATGIHPHRRSVVRPAAGGALMLILINIVARIIFDPVFVFSLFLILMVVLYPVVVVRLGAVSDAEFELLKRFSERFDIDISPLIRFLSRFR